MKKLSLFLSACFLGIGSITAQVYVDKNASGSNTGTSWANAYTDLNIAISTTPSGQIWVKAGMYLPGGSSNSTFTMKNNVEIYGGFNGTEVSLTQRNPRTNVTILSGDLNLNGVSGPGDVWHVVTTGNTNSSAVLDGFVIEYGYATSPETVGGGIYCAPSLGGAHDPIIRNCEIRNNKGEQGGGLHVEGVSSGSAAPQIINCVFHNNAATVGAGGAITMSSTGGSNYCLPNVTNCLFFNNQTATNTGNEIYAGEASGGQIHAVLTNCTFGNPQNFLGSTVQYDNNASPGTFEMYNCILYNAIIQTSAVFQGDNNCIDAGYLPFISGSSNSSFDPLFVNATTNDFHLTCASPAIGGGSNGPVSAAIDLDGLPRIAGTTVDIGAFEKPLPTVIAGATATDVCPGTSVTLIGSGTAVSYSWDNGVTDNVPFNIGSSTITYHVTGTDASGCTNTDLFTINVFALPIVNANVAGSYTVCDGDAVTLYGSGDPAIYTWDNGVTDNTPFNATITNVYTVSGTDVQGCVNTSTITITVNPLPSVTASATNQPVCEGGQTTLTGNGAVSYVWDNGVSNGVPFTPASVGWNYYNVVGTDANGCVSMPWPMSILVESNIGFTAGIDQDACSNNAFLTLSGNTGTSTSFFWSTLGTGSFVSSSTLTPDYYFSGADMSLDTVRIVLAATYTACPVTRDTLKLAIKHPTNNYAGPDITICADAANNIFFSGSAVNQSSVYWYSSTGTGTFAPDQVSMSGTYAASPAEISAGVATLLFISYSQSPACPNDTDDVQITIHPLPVLTPTADYTVCQSDSIYLNEPVTGGTPPYNYIWKTGPPIAIISTSNNQYYHPGQTDTYDIQVTDINGCQAVDTFLVTFDASNDILGTVNVGAGQLTAGTIYLIKYIPQQMIFDTISFWNLSGSGAYSFPTTAHGNYLIKVVPDTVLFPNLLPTYYGDEFQWDSATVVTHNCSTDFTADINMIALLGGTGSGSISGYVLEDVGYGSRFSNGHNHVMVPGGPLKGIDVKLGKNPAGGIQARTMTDTTGHYAFEDLPNDSYRIYVDIPGLPMDSFYVVNINTASDTAINLNYYADSNSVYPILPTAVGLPSHKYTAAGFDVYPNPAKNYTSIRFEVADEQKAMIRILDVTGKAVLSTQLNNLPKGKHEYQLNFEDRQLNSGVYFIEVQTANGVKAMKLIVE